MKKVALLITVALGTIALAGCLNSSTDSTEIVLDTAALSVKKDSLVPSETVVSSMPVGEENFTALVNYIEQKGFAVREREVVCDYQYTFFDSDGNRHALITVRRDKDGKPSLTGKVTQISVWAYYDGIKDQNHYFGYLIDRSRVGPYLPVDDEGIKHMPAIKKGYEEFLAKARS